MTSIVRNSIARLIADGGGFVLSLLTAIMTARWLGPAGKGLVSAITFLSAVVLQICFIGLGDSAIVRIGQKKNSVQSALSASMTALVPAAFVSMALMWAASWLEFRSDWTAARMAVLIACLSLPISMVSLLAANLLNSQERFVTTSSILLAASCSTTAATWVLVVLLNKGIIGAIVATLIGAGSGALLAGGELLRDRVSFRPRIDRDYLTFALSYGPKLQLSQLMVMAAARLDLLVVYSLAGQAAAGQYSVALTAAAIGGMMPLSLMTASFPRLAQAKVLEFDGRTAQLNRFVIAACFVSCCALGIGMPVLIPLAFGHAYKLAISPGLILLIGTLFGSSQYNLSRAWAARGDPKPMFVSHALMTAIMICMDLLLIPPLGIAGAALASAIGQIAGCCWCWLEWTGKGGKRQQLIPGMSDFSGALRIVTSFLRGPGAAAVAVSTSTGAEHDSPNAI